MYDNDTLKITKEYNSHKGGAAILFNYEDKNVYVKKINSSVCIPKRERILFHKGVHLRHISYCETMLIYSGVILKSRKDRFNSSYSKIKEEELRIKIAVEIFNQSMVRRLLKTYDEICQTAEQNTAKLAD